VGIGSDESIILGIDRVCDLAEEARKEGLWPTDEMYPNVISASAARTTATRIIRSGRPAGRQARYTGSMSSPRQAIPGRR